MLRLFLVTLFLLPLPIQAAENWPAWRGDGSGVSNETSLPTSWSVDENVLWRIELEGNGISSPIVWEDKVYLTRALEGEEITISNNVALATVFLLTALALLSAVFVVFVRRSSHAPTTPLPPWFARARWLDRAIAFVAGPLFIGLVGYMVVPQLISGEGTLLKGDPGRGWLWAGVVMATGLIAALGFLRPHSRWRLVGAAGFFVAALVFHLRAPLDSATNPLPLKYLVVTSGSLILAAAWYVVLFSCLRKYYGRAQTKALRMVYPLATLTLALFVFFFVNYWQPKAGLWRNLLCLDANTGEILWESRAFLAPAERRYHDNSWATPTPATDGKHLVAYFGHGLVGMDMQGKINWRVMIPEYMDFLRYGSTSSPVIHDDRVIYTFMAENAEGPDSYEKGRWAYKRHSYVAAVDLATGEEIWRVTPPEAHDSYATPLIVATGDAAAALIATYDHFLAYDVETGDELWRVNVPIWQPVASPVTDGAGEVAYFTGGIHGPAVATAIELGRRGDVTESAVKWKITKGTSCCSSPVLYRGLLYWVTERGILYCVEPETGEVLWRERLSGSAMGSPVAGDGKIYFPSARGDVTVVRASGEFEVLAVNTLGEKSFASPAISGGKIFLRTDNYLYCISETA